MVEKGLHVVFAHSPKLRDEWIIDVFQTVQGTVVELEVLVEGQDRGLEWLQTVEVATVTEGEEERDLPFQVLGEKSSKLSEHVDLVVAELGFRRFDANTDVVQELDPVLEEVTDFLDDFLIVVVAVLEAWGVDDPDVLVGVFIVHQVLGDLLRGRFLATLALLKELGLIDALVAEVVVDPHLLTVVQHCVEHSGLTSPCLPDNQNRLAVSGVSVKHELPDWARVHLEFSRMV